MISLQWVCENATEARYLTAPELGRLQDFFRKAGDGVLARLMVANYAPAPRGCYEVWLTQNEAEVVDRALFAMGEG